MDFTVKKDSISVAGLRVVSSAEHTVHFDVTLPEYMPDVVRVLRCCLIPGVASHGVSGDRITVECDCTVRVIYVCEQGKIHCFEQAEHFGKQLELREEIHDGITVNAKTEFVNYRVGSNRKVEIHGAVSLAAVCIEKAKKEIVCSAQGDGMTVREQKINACTLQSYGRKMFSVSEICEINSNQSIKSVISVSHSVRTDEVKAIHGKVFIRGELCVRSTCLTEDFEILCFENAIGINQIIDVPDITEECITQTDTEVYSITVRPRSDHPGDRGLLEIEADLCTFVQAYNSAEITVILDAFSTKYDTDISYHTVTVNTSCEKIYETFLCRESVDISTVGIRRILSFSCGDAASTVSVSDGSVTVSGTVTADIVFEDTNSEIYYVTRQIPFEHKHPAVYESIVSNNISVSVSAYNFVTGSGGVVDTRIELCLSGLVFCGEETKAVTEITLDKSKCKSVKTASLTVYFADENESVWDIARRYNTTVEAILRENRIQDEKIPHCCKLLIPKI